MWNCGAIRLLIAVIGLLSAAPLAGQGRLIDARLEAALERDPAQAEVRILYRLRPDPSDSAGAHVRVAVIPIPGVQLVEVRVAVAGGNPIPLILATDPRHPRSPRLVSDIALPAGTDEIPVDLYYRVIGPTSEPTFPRRVDLPVVAVLWPPAQAVPGTFTGTVSVHPGLVLRDAFPAELARGPVHTFDLPVTPALLAFTLTATDAGPGLDSVLDAAALLAVLLFGLIGWRRFRAEM